METGSSKDSFESSLSAAEAALRGFAAGPAQEAADAIAAAFEQSSARIARALIGAGAEGENAMRSLAKTVLEEVARAVLARNALSAGAAPSMVARTPVTVNMSFAPGSDAQSIARHQAQIASQIARAVAYGGRNL